MAVPTKAMEVYSLGTMLVNREEEQTPEGTWRTLGYRVTGKTSKNEQWDEVFPGTLEGRHAAIDFVQEQQSNAAALALSRCLTAPPRPSHPCHDTLPIVIEHRMARTPAPTALTELRPRL